MYQRLRRALAAAALTVATTAALTVAGAGSAQAVSTTDDLVWFNADSGVVSTWLLRYNGTVLGTQELDRRCDRASGCSNAWRPIGAGDMTGDGAPDIIWFNETTGQVASWLLDGTGHVLDTQYVDWRCAKADCGQQWNVVGLGDVNRDGHPDLVWWNATTGEVGIWIIDNHGTVLGAQYLDRRSAWSNDPCQGTWPIAVGDVTGDGVADIVWADTATAQLSAWVLDGAGHVIGTQALGANGDSYHCNTVRSMVVGVGDLDGNHYNDLIWWELYTGEITGWLRDAGGSTGARLPLDWRCSIPSGCAAEWYPFALMHAA
jgi:hypothetical protein